MGHTNLEIDIRTGPERRGRSHGRSATATVAGGALLMLLIQGCAGFGGTPLGTELLFRERRTGQVVSCTAGSDCERHYRGAGLECFAELHRPVESPRVFTVRRCTE